MQKTALCERFRNSRVKACEQAWRLGLETQDADDVGQVEGLADLADALHLRVGSLAQWTDIPFQDCIARLAQYRRLASLRGHARWSEHRDAVDPIRALKVVHHAIQRAGRTDIDHTRQKGHCVYPFASWRKR